MKSLQESMVRIVDEAIVKSSGRTIRIVSIIVRNGLSALFVGKYLDSRSSDQYLFFEKSLIRVERKSALQ